MTKARSLTTVLWSNNYAVIAFALAVASSPAYAAKTESEIRLAVQTILMDRHPQELPEWWRGLGAGAPSVIRDMYATDPSTYHHMRLLEGLSSFTGDTDALAFVEHQAEQTPDDVVRNAAIRAVVLNHGAAQEEWVSQFLRHDDPHTRLLAAESLRKFRTPAAAAKVSTFLADEKLPWVLAALRGDLPVPTGPQQPSGSSEDRLSPDFAGTWQGFWLVPRSDNAAGMKSQAAELKLSFKSGGTLAGELQIKEKAKIRSLAVDAASGKSTHLKTRFLEELPLIVPAADGSKTKKEEILVDVELIRQGTGYFLELHVPQSPGVLLLRRDPASAP